MQRWIIRHVGIALALGVNLVTLGVCYASMRDDIQHARENIKLLQDQRADETRWAVQQHEKRLDGHDAVLNAFSEKLERISLTLERIDQRTAGRPLSGPAGMRGELP